MRVTIEIDDVRWRMAANATNIDDPSELVRHLVEKLLDSLTPAQRLAARGGTMPDLEIPPRKRPGTDLP